MYCFRANCLHKQPRGDSHFCGHVTPFFVIFQPFYSTSSAPILDSLTFPLSLAYLFLSSSTFLKLIIILFWMHSTVYLFHHTSLSTFNCHCYNSQAFVFIQTLSTFFESSMIFNLRHFTGEPYNCHNHKSELRTFLLTLCSLPDSQF